MLTEIRRGAILCSAIAENGCVSYVADHVSQASSLQPARIPQCSIDVPSVSCRSTTVSGNVARASSPWPIVTGHFVACGLTSRFVESCHYHRSLTVNQNTIALSSDRGSLEISGVSLLYEGTRAKSYLLGRDLNPMGRGDGSLYAQGAFVMRDVRPKPSTRFSPGHGNSINNPGIGLAVDKEIDPNSLVISGNSVQFNYIIPGDCPDCPHCFSAIPLGCPGCWLTIHMYGSCGECAVKIACDGCPVDGKCRGGNDYDPRGPLDAPCVGIGAGSGGNGMSIPASPLPGSSMPGGCPGCDVPAPPTTNMPGPQFPGRSGIPGLPGQGGGIVSSLYDPMWIYGPGVVKAFGGGLGSLQEINIMRGLGSTYFPISAGCYARCMKALGAGDRYQPPFISWDNLWDFLINFTAGYLAGDLLSKLTTAVKALSCVRYFALPLGVKIHMLLAQIFVGIDPAIWLVTQIPDVGTAVWNSRCWLRDQIFAALCFALCYSKPLGPLPGVSHL